MSTRTLWSMLALVGVLAGSGWSAGPARNRNQGPTVVATAPTPLTATETANIVRLREEEKLARDVYRVFLELWKAPIFTNIAEAEQRHMDALGLLVTKYGLTDPVTDDTVGVFSTPEFANLFATLTQSGAKSLLDALKAGVQIEQADIADLTKALAETNKSDIQWVLGNLQRASSNHLRAFTANVGTGGTASVLQSAAGTTGKGKGPGNGVCPVCGRSGRGNGYCYRNGNGSGNQNGVGQGNRQRKRDGTCLLLNSAQS
jgi:hypothetical protein